MNALRRCHLFNNHHDRVKVVLRKKGFFQIFFDILNKFKFAGYFPSWISEFNQPTFRIRLPRIRPRLPFRCISQLLWTMGLYSSRMYHYGNSKCYYQFIRLSFHEKKLFFFKSNFWFFFSKIFRIWMFYERSNQWPSVLWNLYCGPTWYRYVGLYTNLYFQKLQNTVSWFLPIGYLNLTSYFFLFISRW